MRLKPTLLAIILVGQNSYAASVFISEIHYDNAGADVNEFLEIYVSSSVDIADVTGQLYNGNGGTSYNTISGAEWAIGETVTLADGVYVIYSAEPSSIQNDGPDGMAIGVSGVLCEFLSYEGTFTASGGIADGLISNDIGVAETSVPEGTSLSRTDAGWIVTPTNSQGLANASLTINPIPEPSSALLSGLGLLALLLRRR